MNMLPTTKKNFGTAWRVPYRLRCATGVLFAACWLSLCPSAGAWATDTAEGTVAVTDRAAVQELIRQRFQAPGAATSITIDDETITRVADLSRFYRGRAFYSAWSDDRGPLPRASALLNVIRQGSLDGLNPESYGLSRLQSRLDHLRQGADRGERPPLQQLADLDVMLSEAFVRYGSHLSRGRFDPIEVDPEWFAKRHDPDLAQILAHAIDTDSVTQTLEGLAPQNPAYGRLRQALTRYREIAAGGGWRLLPSGPKLQKGDRGIRVAALRERLAAEGYTTVTDTNALDHFDYTLDEAVRTFQRQRGLQPDGVVGPATRDALNVSAQERVRQIEINLERWRWLPHDLGARYIMVNVAGYELDVVDRGQTVMTMRVVVGKPYQRTPVFSAKMSYLVVSPYWNVPPSIAVKEILPELRKDPEYLAKHQMELLRGWGADRREIEPNMVDWSRINKDNFPFWVRQRPGPKNPLGSVKFMLPNRFDVYLHDTSQPYLFRKAERGFSHGCIRIEKPLDLMAYVLGDNSRWSPQAVADAIRSGREQTVGLPERIPVHVLYWTAWVEEDGTVQFRKDVYGRDKLLEAALNGRNDSLTT